MNILQARQLGVSLQGRALLQDLSLDIAACELHVLLGPNGAGKSTLLRTLAGEWPPASGGLLFDGRPLAETPPLEQARRRAVLPQHDGLSFGLSVRELIALGRYPCKDQRPATTQAVVDAVMAATQITALADRRYPTLSGGERRRAQLARVLAQVWDVPQALLLLDEPTHSLDLAHQHAVLALLQQLAQQGHAVLISLHELNLAARYANRVSLLRDGHLLASGSPAQVLDEAHLQALYGHSLRFQAVDSDGARQWLTTRA